jgi:hypothetical protein
MLRLMMASLLRIAQQIRHDPYEIAVEDDAA